MNRGSGDDFMLSLKSIADVLLKRFWIILMTIVVVVGLAMLLSFLQTPQYEASVRMLVGQDRGITESPNEAVGLQQLTQTMAVAADSRPVAQSVIDELNLDLTTEEFFENLSVEQVSATQFIEISYRAPDPQEAQRIANATGEAFSEQISEVSSGATQITATLYEQAEVPEDPVTPDFVRNAAIALVLGGMLGVGLAFLLELLDDRWSSPEEAENALGVPVFGVVPVFEGASGEGSERIRQALAAGLSREGPRSFPPRQEERPAASGAIGFGPTALPTVGRDGVLWPVGMALLGPDGEVEEADATLLGLLGRESGEVAGAEFATLASHPEDAERHRSLQRSLASGAQGSYSLEKRLIDARGQVLWAEVTVSAVGEERSRPGALAMVKDVSPLKQLREAARISEEARTRAEERLKALTGDSSQVNVGFFSPDGYALSEDAAWHELWHELWYEPGETNGESVLDNERIREVGLDRYFRESLDKRTETVTPPLRLRPSNGEERERWLRAVIRPVEDGRGGVREVMMLLEDLTDTKPEEAVAVGELRERLAGIETAREEEREQLARCETLRQEIEARLTESERARRQVEGRLVQIQKKLGAILSPPDGQV